MAPAAVAARRRAPLLACSASGWQAERHVFFGDPRTVREKISAAEIGVDRRLFYATVETADSARIFEFEHQRGDLYRVRAASVDAKTARHFNTEVERAMFENQGNSCVGKAVQSLPIFKGLKFEDLGEEAIDPAVSFLSLVEEEGEHTLHPRQNGKFHQVSFSVLC